MLTSTQGACGTGNRVYNPIFCFLCLVNWQIQHCLTILAISLLRLSQWKWSSTRAMVLSQPKWPATPPVWSSHVRKSRREVRGMQSLFPFKRKPSLSTNPLILRQGLSENEEHKSLLQWWPRMGTMGSRWQWGHLSLSLISGFTGAATDDLGCPAPPSPLCLAAFHSHLIFSVLPHSSDHIFQASFSSLIQEPIDQPLPSLFLSLAAAAPDSLLSSNNSLCISVDPDHPSFCCCQNLGLLLRRVDKEANL